MKKQLKIKFVDFWPDLNEENNFFLHLLGKYYNLEISDEPDLIFYSNFGFEHLKYKCIKIYYTGENRKPNYYYCDYAFSFEDNGDKNFFLPHFVEYDHFFDFKNNTLDTSIQNYQNIPKKQFCSFIASNPNAKTRIDFVKELMTYKKVDCSGPVLYNMPVKNNIGKLQNDQYVDWRQEKIDVIKHYKFTIAFENEQSFNYVTEKIYQPLLVRSIPIYWGAPNINEFFNPKCFIDVSQFKSFADAIEYIKQVDQNQDLYNSFFKEPAITENSKLFSISPETIYYTVRTLIDRESVPIGNKRHIQHLFLYYLKSIKHRITSFL